MNTNSRTIGVYDGPLEFRSWVMSLGCPAHIVDSVAAKNKRDAVQIAARKAELAIERRSAVSQPQVKPRSKNGVAYRWAQIEDGLICEDSERDARRRRMMAAIL
jgi:hypothetical protein